MRCAGVPRQAVGLQAGDKLKGKANEAGRKAQNAVGNTSQLPSPQDVRHSHCYQPLIWLCGVCIRTLVDRWSKDLLVLSASHG